MEREFSAGGVVIRQIDGSWWLAAIQPRRSEEERKKSPKSVLALPKGLIDPGEKPVQTALREVHEETGVTAELVTKLRDIKYVYVRSWGNKQKVFKVVSFFLFRYLSGSIGEISVEMKTEVDHAEWVPLETAERKLSYPGEREVVRAAREYLRSHPLDGSSNPANGQEN